ncbi:hypothetical protein J7T55_008910 [Diaporthe amygdali]|uniref:uncharacterized protein n=1 Tax=Phomopsis amygdali TaxID=1214568 RepID=UPI0022FE3CFA|nr:uncharacterized protein J7T55_008910 [Diaporthe amygdali]KAJ0121743.1 hypothetical protein J7T55_008910 [Diaporthe amygdali]
MGGKVFSSGPDPLDTPRMSQDVYKHVKNKCTNALKDLGFSHVVSPVEAPEKKSFGDVDILACLEGTRFLSSAQLDNSTWAGIEMALDAKRSHSESRIGPAKQRIIDSKSFAVPWPAGFALGEDVQGLNKTPSAQAKDLKTASGRQFIQIDLRLCDTHQELEWRIFKHNHGDLWNMIGQTIRPFGLTADEIGLHIRIPEIERQDKKKARVLLSSEPDKVIEFLGLMRHKGEKEKPFVPEEEEPFDSVKDLFEYAASCKWFMLWPENPEEKATTHDDTEANAIKQIEAELKKLKANDRARMKQRPVFARWVDEFIPACRAQGRFVVPNPEKRTLEDVRNEVRELAFNTFPGSEADYNASLADWNKEKTRIFVKNKVIKEDMCLPTNITAVLPSPRERDGDTSINPQDLEKNWRGALRSALAKVIIDDDETFEGIVPPRLRDADGVLEVDAVKDWINLNWEEVGRVAWRSNYARAEESRKRKEATKEAQEGKATVTIIGGKP